QCRNRDHGRHRRHDPSRSGLRPMFGRQSVRESKSPAQVQREQGDDAKPPGEVVVGNTEEVDSLLRRTVGPRPDPEPEALCDSLQGEIDVDRKRSRDKRLLQRSIGPLARLLPTVTIFAPKSEPVTIVGSSFWVDIAPFPV